MLAYLTGADLDLNVFRAKWKKSTAIGLVGFFSSTCDASPGAARVLGGLRDLACHHDRSQRVPPRLLASSRPFVRKEAHRPARTQGPYLLRQVLRRFKQE